MEENGKKRDSLTELTNIVLLSYKSLRTIGVSRMSEIKCVDLTVIAGQLIVHNYYYANFDNDT